MFYSSSIIFAIVHINALLLIEYIIVGIHVASRHVLKYVDKVYTRLLQRVVLATVAHMCEMIVYGYFEICKGRACSWKIKIQDAYGFHIASKLTSSFD